jgi:hypothetical protein
LRLKNRCVHRHKVDTGAAESIQRGSLAAARVLGRADQTGMLAWRNYVDRSQLESEQPLPPPIGMA